MGTKRLEGLTDGIFAIVMTINILSLMFIALIPISAYLPVQFNQIQTAVLIFEAHVFVIQLLYFIEWVYATKNKLFNEELNQDSVKIIFNKNMAVPVGTVICMGLSFLNLQLSILMLFIIPIIALRYKEKELGPNLRFQ